MTCTRDKSFLTQLPNELYYSILDFLGEEDETQQASLGILNLALSGYGDSKFVSAWCDRKAEADLTALNSLEQMNRGI
jgi:cytosine/adenosine deaminase-related metal-dependent hydrolase